jgi:hypothetical protein
MKKRIWFERSLRLIDFASSCHCGYLTTPAVSMCLSSSSSSFIIVQSVALAASSVAQLRNHQEGQRGRLHRWRPRVHRRTGAYRRSRKKVKHFHQQLGPNLVKQAYRMTYHSFKRLLYKLRRGIIQYLVMTKGRRRNNNDSYKRYVPNGPITPSVWLACAFCYFAGGSPMT